MGAGSSQPSENDEQAIVPQQDRRKTSNRRHSEETLDCPTCQGTGRIPRGQESKLVAVIPCSDQRLKPRHTKLYVTVSVTLCLLVSSLVLFFLFPRSVILSPGAVESVYVYFTPTTVQLNITFAFEIPVTLVEEGLNNYCKKSTIKIHTLFVHLQMSMTVYYLAHFEQLSLDTYEYIDCGSNTTTPHIINPTP
ncbi:transmembrane protein 106B-like isoform X2 [Salvelinus alpinus]|uniref:transmembrane protein 106B-like isoform X2 n=1 Tax=Salvelinus alpinus TaxID=8036 RepID=UPI0039FBBD37